MAGTPSNPFVRLGLEPRFDLRRADVERATLRRLATLHPDRSSEDAAAAAGINDARSELLDPERRANALLAALNGPSASDLKTLPDGFLQEIMAVRLELEDDAVSGDIDRIDRWHGWADDERGRYIATITEAFRSNAPLDEVRTTLNAWRYIERLRAQLPPGSLPPVDSING